MSALGPTNSRVSPETTRPLVVAVGLATADLIQRVERAPGPNEKVWATDARLTFGGPAANAVATAVLHGCRGRLIAPVGQAGMGPMVARELAEAGVELIDIAGRGYEPPISSVTITEASGERSVVSLNARWATTTLPVTAGMLEGGAVLLVDGHLMGHQHEAARLAREGGLTVIQDGGSWKPGGIPHLTSLTDIALVSADFRVPGLEGDGWAILDWLAERGARWAARSHGEGPLAIRWPTGEREELSVAPVASIVDTLGAGDVLHGALAAALAHTLTSTTITDLTPPVLRAAFAQAIAAARASLSAPGVPRAQRHAAEEQG